MLIPLILIGAYAAILLALIAYAKHITIPFAGLVLTVIGALFSAAIYNVNPWFIMAIIALFALWFVYCYYFKRLDFTQHIYSLALPHKIKDGRIIGKVLPYYKKQLKYNNSIIVQDDLSLAGGTIITGSSGSGKTHAMLDMISQDLNKGRSVVHFNFKGDQDSADDIKAMAEKLHLPVYELSYDGVSFSYDPLKNLDNAGRVEAILNMRAWAIDSSDAHYKTGVQFLLQKTLNDFVYQGDNFLYEYYTWLKTYNVEKTDWDAYSTILKLLEITIESNVGKMFQTKENPFTFTNSEQYVLLISFTSATKTLGTSITALMLKDLMEVGTKNTYSPALSLYIDEFGSCESPLIVKDILEKGRSCGIYTTISMQDLNQLIINTNAPFLDSVLGTVNSYIIFAGSTKQTAEKISGTQIHEIDDLLLSLKKPIDGNPPTAMFISKYPVFEKRTSEVYRFVPIKDKSEVKDKKQGISSPSKPQSKIDTINQSYNDTNALKTPYFGSDDEIAKSEENQPQNEPSDASFDVSEWL